MDRISELLLTDLRSLIIDLGKEGGLMSPSIYDTAQVARYAPPAEGVWPALEWLLDQQQGDGGWGNRSAPLARDVPTLAAVLALYASSARKTIRIAVQEGIAFLRRQAAQWSEKLPDDLPVGVELLLPHLLDEAARAGIMLPRELYQPLISLGVKRRRMIASLQLRPGTTPVHSWEAFGENPDPALLDDLGSVAHSPAATAFWLHKAEGRQDLHEAAAAARNYLSMAAAATGAGLPGVVPTAWPITRFEQIYVLHTLLGAGLMDHPALCDATRQVVDTITSVLRPDGLGFSDSFTSDGDDTASAIAVLHAAGQPVDPAPLESFRENGSFLTYHHELQPSLITTARGAHALLVIGADARQAQAHLLAHQQTSGQWLPDKWNSSWLYTTALALLALGDGAEEAKRRAATLILAHQQHSGAWSSNPTTTMEETAYAILALRQCNSCDVKNLEISAALSRADRWMLDNYRPFAPSEARCWLAKENYRPLRVARAIELAAMLSVRI